MTKFVDMADGVAMLIVAAIPLALGVACGIISIIWVAQAIWVRAIYMALDHDGNLPFLGRSRHVPWNRIAWLRLRELSAMSRLYPIRRAKEILQKMAANADTYDDEIVKDGNEVWLGDERISTSRKTPSSAAWSGTRSTRRAE
jgi:hypothetical protein